MNDPFAVLGVFEHFEASSISHSFMEATHRGLSAADARAAMDVLRDPHRREAAALLAPSMSQAACAARLRAPNVDESGEAVQILLRYLRVALEQIDADLVGSAVRPIRRFDPDHYLDPLPDFLIP